MHKVAEKQRVLVAMSGGVDSSVTAALLKTQGYDVVGVHMKLWDNAELDVRKGSGRCCSLADASDARRVCDKIDIPFYVIDATDVFKDKVVDHFVHEYVQNRTPNPCVECNTRIKFSYLLERADEIGCALVATGHYAQIMQDTATSLWTLCKAVDGRKDQSYFLFGLTQNALRRTLMPLGGFTKEIVRKLAHEFDLPVAEKPDSQEICFVGEEGYKEFIEGRVAQAFRPKGMIRTTEGQVVGDHDGLFRYTIGQRKGLQMIGPDAGEYYVVGFDTTSSAIIVGPESELFKKEFVADNANWVKPIDGLRGLRCKAKIRSRHEEAACRVTLFENNIVHVEFDEPQRAITPGQAVVFYKGDELVGGAYVRGLGRLA